MEHALVAMESKTRRVNGFEVLGLDRLRGSETVGAKWWRCVGNALERVDAGGDRAAHGE